MAAMRDKVSTLGRSVSIGAEHRTKLRRGQPPSVVPEADGTRDAAHACPARASRSHSAGSPSSRAIAIAQGGRVGGNQDVALVNKRERGRCGRKDDRRQATREAQHHPSRATAERRDENTVSVQHLARCGRERLADNALAGHGSQAGLTAHRLGHMDVQMQAWDQDPRERQPLRR